MRQMAVMFLLGFLISGGAVVRGQGNAAADGDAVVRRALDGMVQKGEIFGGVAAVYKNGQLGTVAVGKKFYDAAAPNSNTLYEIGSVTKVFTSAMLAKAVDSGKIKLDDAINSHLPDYVHLRQEVQGKITFKRLATFTASLPDKAPASDTTAKEVLGKYLSGWTPRTPVGSEDKYSDLSYELLSFLVLRLENSSYDALLSKSICQPLGMTHTSTNTAIQRETNRAYAVDEEGYKTRYDRASWNGVGFVVSTGSDMGKFLQACIGVTPGSPELQRALALSTKGYFPMKGGDEQGLAWVIHKVKTSSGTATLISKDGIVDGFFTLIVFDRDAKSGVVFLTNRDAIKVKATPKLFPVAEELLTGERGGKKG